MHRRRPRDLPATGDGFEISKKSELKNVAVISREAGYLQQLLANANIFVTQPAREENGTFVTVCRENTHTHPRDRREAELACGIQDNARIGLVLIVVVTHVHRLYSIEVQVLSKSHGLDKYVAQNTGDVQHGS